MTKKVLNKLAERLEFSPVQFESFRAMLPSSKYGDIEFQPLELDLFEVISDWYHYAILELITVESFDASPTWIARCLGITQAEARDALDRLIRLGLLVRDAKTGSVNPGAVSNYSNADCFNPNGAQKKHQGQILNLAMQALEEIPAEERDQTSVTLAIPHERLAEARERITQFRRELSALLQRPGKRDSVYQLSISLFPLTRSQLACRESEKTARNARAIRNKEK